MRPSGIGGWLILPALGLVISPFLMGVILIRDTLPTLSPDVWHALTDPASDAYHPMWAPTLLFELVANIAMLVFTFWLAYLFFSKSARTPGLFIGWLLFNVAIQVIDQVLIQSIPIAAEQPDPIGIRDLVRSIIGAFIWIPYFLRSERVRNTFTVELASYPTRQLTPPDQSKS